MELEFQLDQSSLGRILAKLDRGKSFLQGPAAARIKWKLDLFDEYKKMVTHAMGSVKAFGGYVKMGFHGETGGTYWKNLAPATLAYKAAEAGLPEEDDPYDAYRGEFSIWLDTGATKSEGVTVSKDFTFVGIPRSSFLLERASRTERGLPSQTGKLVPPRPLFEVANFLFLAAVHKAMENPESELARKLREEVVGKLKVALNWGE